MISKENIVEFLVDLSVSQDYLDIDNDIVEKIATGVYQRIVANDTTFFGIPQSDTVMTHSIEDAPIRRAITMMVNTSKIAMGGRTGAEFAKAKKEYFYTNFRVCADTPLHTYNLLKNMDQFYMDEVFHSFLEEDMINSVYKNETVRNHLNESLLSRGIISNEKDADFYERLKVNVPSVFMYWVSIFFSDNTNYLTDLFISKMIEKVNKRDLDLSYYFDVFSHLDTPVSEDIDELTEDEVELMI